MIRNISSDKGVLTYITEVEGDIVTLITYHKRLIMLLCTVAVVLMLISCSGMVNDPDAVGAGQGVGHLQCDLGRALH